MRRGELFWGPLLVILGVLFFLKAAGFIAGDVFGWFWPILIIAVGAWVLLGGLRYRGRYETAEKFSVPLQDAREASLTIQHGMGQIDLRAGANPGDFLTGVSGVGMNKKTRLNNGKLEVEIEAGPSYLPFIGPDGGVWQYRLTPDVPLTIKVEAGATRLDLDLSDLRVTQFSFEGGASSVNLKLPKTVNSLVDLEAGAASLDISVPEGVGLRLRTKSVGSLHIDGQRFPMLGTNLYQSSDYDSAACHADVTIDGGATSINVH
jgi:hypothetical protein